MILKKIPKFWHWLIFGCGGTPGFARITDRWILLHAFIGLALAFYVPASLQDAAISILVPLAGLLIGLSFAWAANAQALLQSEEIEEITKNTAGGFPDYVYSFLLAVLVVLVSLSIWGLAGLGIYDKVWPTATSACYFSVKAVLYLLLSLTIRTSWHVVLGSQSLLLMRWAIRDKRKGEAKQER
jgi:hypothetical protein